MIYMNVENLFIFLIYFQIFKHYKAWPTTIQQVSGAHSCRIQVSLRPEIDKVKLACRQTPLSSTQLPQLSQSDINSRTQSRTRQAASVAGEAVTIVEKPF